MKNKLIEFDCNVALRFSDFLLVGIDEVGRGALAGPVVACAFTWKENLKLVNKKYSKDLLFKLNDSKQLDVRERTVLSKLLLKLGNFGIGYASVLEIENLNILNATFLAMKRAFDNLVLEGHLEPYVLIDGNKFNPYINCKQTCITSGDAKSSLIAGASIIAKVYRDNLMKRISRLYKYKKYGWVRNVGYGTSYHRNAIIKYGTTPLHRKLFVRKTLNRISSPVFRIP